MATPPKAEPKPQAVPHRVVEDWIRFFDYVMQNPGVYVLMWSLNVFLWAVILSLLHTTFH